MTFDAAAETLTTSTNLASKAGTYPLRLSAKFTGSHYTNVGTLDFTMTLVDPCPSATISLVSAPSWPMSAVTWSLGDA